jgi:hypothetical protein
MMALFRKPRNDSRVRLHELMRMRGIFVPVPATAEGARDLAMAIGRCLQCPSKKLCDELVAGNDSEGHRYFCPNIHYIERRARD